MLKALTVAALLAIPATAFAHGGGGHGGGFGGGHFGGGAHVGAFHGVSFHNRFHDGRFGRFGHARFFFGPGFAYGGGSSCWAWTPAGWQWVCGY